MYNYLMRKSTAFVARFTFLDSEIRGMTIEQQIQLAEKRVDTLKRRLNRMAKEHDWRYWVFYVISVHSVDRKPARIHIHSLVRGNPGFTIAEEQTIFWRRQYHAKAEYKKCLTSDCTGENYLNRYMYPQQSKIREQCNCRGFEEILLAEIEEATILELSDKNNNQCNDSDIQDNSDSINADIYDQLLNGGTDDPLQAQYSQGVMPDIDPPPCYIYKCISKGKKIVSRLIDYVGSFVIVKNKECNILYLSG